MLCSTLLWKEELSFTKGLPFKSMQSKANKHTFTFIHLQFQIHLSWHQHDISHWDTLAPSGGLDVLDIDVLTASCRQHLGAKGVDCQRKPICWNLRSIPTHQTSLSISSSSILAVLYTSFNNMTPRLQYRFDESWCLKWQNLLVHLVVCHQLAVNDATFHVLGQGVLDDLCDEGDIIWDPRRLLRWTWRPGKVIITKGPEREAELSYASCATERWFEPPSQGG